MKRRKMILIDGNSLAHRAFYALPPFTTVDGVPTNAVYGFLTMLFRLTEEEAPDYLAVAFDKSAPTFRHQEFADYKAHRKPMPDDLRPQFPVLKDVLSALKIKIVEIEGFEADDVLGTLSRQAEEAGLDTVVVTGDRDALQLVSDRVRVALTRKGISELAYFDPAAVREAYGVEPVQMIDIKGLMGDPSDNIPGVPGIGEKTATKLIQEFGSVEAVLENLEKVSGKKLSETLAENAGSARLSKRLATIDRQAPIEVDIESCRVTEPDYSAAYQLFKRLEFKSLLKKVDKGKGVEPPAAEALVQCRVADTPEVLRDLRRRAGEAPRVAYLMVSPGPGGPGGLALSLEPGEAWWVPGAPSEEFDLPEGLELVTHDAKPALVRAIRRGEKAPASTAGPRRPAFDTAIAAYLLDPTRSAYDLAGLARQYDLGELPSEDAPARFWGSRAAVLLPLRDRLEAEMQAAGMWELFRDVEMPLVLILAEMEAAGVGVDRSGLDQMADELEDRIAELTREIYRLAGTEFNVNSTRQLGEVLFDKLGLPVIKRTKTGPSTDADVLEELAPRHEVVARILDYRTLVKLKGTYVDGLRALIDDRGRIHTTFNQTITATGRLSSTEPNLQNIPIRIEEGRRIRKVFVPTKPDHLLLAADYSQIELRVLAHYSGDRALVEAFHEDQDIHTRTAAEVFGVTMDEVTPAMRGRAKAVNFGLAYGQGAFGLARSLGIPQAEAKDFIDRYFARYPGVKHYMEEKIAEARTAGFVTTLMGRRRYLPEIKARQFAVRQNGERMAINTPIQGTAADIIKAAMVRVHRELRNQGLKAQMILQVHDELVFEVPEDEVGALATLVRREMEGAMALDVPLKVDVKVGPNWYDMKKINR